jgi:hypothetical protein
MTPTKEPGAVGNAYAVPAALSLLYRIADRINRAADLIKVCIGRKSEFKCSGFQNICFSFVRIKIAHVKPAQN